MKPSAQVKKLVTTSAACALACGLAIAQEPANLFPEGNFESTPYMQAPNPNPIHSDALNAQEGVLYIEPGDYKNKGCMVSIENEDGSSFLRFTAPDSFTGILRTYIALKLPDPAPATLTISQRWRVSDLVPNSNAPAWASVQNDPIFVLSDGTQKVIHGTLRLAQSTNGEWQEVEKTVSVPEDAKMLVLQPGLYCVTGTLDIDDIKVFAE